jgi:hypothetical protein
VQIVAERGRDAEVAAAAAQAPQQFRLGLGINVQVPAISGDQVDGTQVVDSESVAAE